jgi:hypothetical protein
MTRPILCSRTRVLLFATALAPAVSCAAHAQPAQNTLGSPEETRRSCSAAAAAIASNSSAKGVSFSTALRRLQTCSIEAPVALAQRWSAPPTDSAELRIFAGVTAQVRDRRLVVATITAARARSLPTSVRLAALGVLVTYFRSDLYAIFPATPTGAGQRPRDYVQIGHWGDPVSFPGAQPFTDAAVHQQVLTTLKELAANESEVRLRMAAAYLADFLPTASSTKRRRG